MTVIESTSRDVSFKLGTFYLILLIDLILTSFVELNVKQMLSDPYDEVATIVIFVIQVVAQGVLFTWFLALFWSTVLLKFGLVILLLRNFKYSVLYVVLSVLLNIAERVIRLIYSLQNHETVETVIWDFVVYRVLYYIRFANLIPFYVVLFSVAQRITRPEYYKPSKWLTS